MMKMMPMMMKSAVLTAFLLAASTAAARAAECKSCRFDCPDGTTNCWSCGTRVPGSENPRKLVPGKLIVVDVLAKKRAARPAGVARDPSGDIQEVEKWIDAHPDDYAGALKRLEPLLDAVRGTVYEPRVEDRIGRIRAAVEEASRPMTPEEREKKAATMVARVAAQVRKRAGDPGQNVRDLEQLLAVAKGTSYEGYVRQLLKTEKAKLKR
ncbi:MAG: hypothetical protein ACYS9X_25580 [Planctomycetota bacterium]|jgi:hypothetical protein